MVEDVVELRSEFKRFALTNHDPLQDVEVPVIRAASSQCVTAEITAPSRASQKSDVLCGRRIDTGAACIRISVKGRSNCNAARIIRCSSHCRNGSDSFLPIRIEIRPV